MLPLNQKLQKKQSNLLQANLRKKSRTHQDPLQEVTPVPPALQEALVLPLNQNLQKNQSDLLQASLRKRSRTHQVQPQEVTPVPLALQEVLVLPLNQNLQKNQGNLLQANHQETRQILHLLQDLTVFLLLSHLNRHLLFKRYLQLKMEIPRLLLCLKLLQKQTLSILKR